MKKQDIYDSVTQQCESAAPEGGNVWFVGLEPEDMPLSLIEKLVAVMVFTASFLISIGLLIAAFDFFYPRFFN